MLLAVIAIEVSLSFQQRGLKICACIFTCIHTHIHHIYVHVDNHTHKDIFIYTHTQVDKHIYTFIHMYICIYKHTHISTLYTYFGNHEFKLLSAIPIHPHGVLSCLAPYHIYMSILLGGRAFLCFGFIFGFQLYSLRSKSASEQF